MTIRMAENQDQAAIARLATELGYPADAGVIARRLARIAGREDQLVLVAVVEDMVVGWIQAHACDVLESGFRVEVVGLIVDAGHRRCGVGRELMRRAEQWAVEIRAETLVVRSNTKRLESHAFFPALGFSRAKNQTVYRKQVGCERRPTSS